MHGRLKLVAAMVTLVSAVMAAAQLAGQVSRPALIGTCAAFFAAGAAMVHAIRGRRDARPAPPAPPVHVNEGDAARPAGVAE